MTEAAIENPELEQTRVLARRRQDAEMKVKRAAEDLSAYQGHIGSLVPHFQRDGDDSVRIFTETQQKLRERRQALQKRNSPNSMPDSQRLTCCAKRKSS